MNAKDISKVLIRENNDPLTELKKNDFVLEPMYFKQGISSTDKMYLRKTVVEKLLQIQKKFKKYRFKIWDAYRPRDVQRTIYQRFWDELHIQHPEWNNEQLDKETSVFVANPDTDMYIPPHLTGGTIDLTLADENGKELDMGTVFDFFGPKAEPYYFEKNNIDEKVKNNRKLFREAMFEEDFSVDTDEWWHFNYGNQFWAVERKKPFAFYGEAHL